MKGASDGTLRLVAYYILLNQSELPPLIAIEEPERNLHPGALTDIANVLEQIAERTQVIITTHSSQLLDAFNPEEFIRLARNVHSYATFPDAAQRSSTLRICVRDQAALDGWITDFGIGSAIFDSNLIDPMEE